MLKHKMVLGAASRYYALFDFDEIIRKKIKSNAMKTVAAQNKKFFRLGHSSWKRNMALVVFLKYILSF